MHTLLQIRFAPRSAPAGRTAPVRMYGGADQSCPAAEAAFRQPSHCDNSDVTKVAVKLCHSTIAPEHSTVTDSSPSSITHRRIARAGLVCALHNQFTSREVIDEASTRSALV